MAGTKIVGTVPGDGINYRPQPSYEAKKKTQLLKDEIESVVELSRGAESDEEDN